MEAHQADHAKEFHYPMKEKQLLGCLECDVMITVILMITALVMIVIITIIRHVSPALHIYIPAQLIPLIFPAAQYTGNITSSTIYQSNVSSYDAN